MSNINRRHRHTHDGYYIAYDSSMDDGPMGLNLRASWKRSQHLLLARSARTNRSRRNLRYLPDGHVRDLEKLWRSVSDLTDSKQGRLVRRLDTNATWGF